MLLDRINRANDIKLIDKDEYDELAQEIRDFLIEHVSETGGHLASNLGAVELTMALHLALDLPNDKIVWDVGHQAYTHKLLTGRKDDFASLRSYGGMSGFPKRRENPCDSFDTGHSSTSISAALGIVSGNAINNIDSTVVAVIGDGALTGGMALEALNNLAELKRNLIIILNDNEMSISKNVGGLSSYLSDIRAGESYNSLKDGVVDTLNNIPVVGDKLVKQIRKTKSSIKQLVIPGMLFENMGITYLGPVDGHNIDKMVRLINEAKNLDHPVLIHVNTKKGKGYYFAEKHPARFHGIGPFDVSTGKPIENSEKPTYTKVFSRTMLRLAKDNGKVVAITAAMPDGTGLKRFAREYPDRFFDVGIAEEHAVTFAAGLATTGLKPVVAIYSSFLQRAYDQILHDVCIQDLPVVFAIDRAGIVGEDGETHQGIFDLSFLSSVPNMNIFAPKNKYELVEVMEFAMDFNGPIAIRYPRGQVCDKFKEHNAPIRLGKSEYMSIGKDIALICVGSMVETGMQVKEMLDNIGYRPTVINARFVKPIDEQMIDEIINTHKIIFTLEENVIKGGYGENVLKYVVSRGYDTKVINIGIPNMFVPQGNTKLLKEKLGLSKSAIFDKITDIIGGNDEGET